MKRITRAVPILLLLLPLAALLAPRRGVTVPLYAARNGMMCGQCHFDPNGGGPRNEFGFNFAKNRHSLVADTSGQWKDMTALVNRVGDNFPLYFGLNQRFMLLANQTIDSTHADVISFANMETDLHVAFQPHSKLTLVYTMYGTDGLSGIFRTNEAFGKIDFLPNAYLKAGRFRAPFGLRMDDHTVATRNGFLDFIGGGSFLPFDPRITDEGVELGGDSHGFFGRMAFTNGSAPSAISGVPAFAEAKTVKIGYNNAWYQNGISLYDDLQKSGSDPQNRFTRWSYYGMTHWRSLSVLGEIGAGTTENLAVSPTFRTNLLAWFAQADYAFTKWVNLRGRVDELVLDRDPDPVIRDANTFYRYSIEGEWVPVPFGEIRWTLRYIDPKSSLISDQRQAYLQFHFSY